MTNNKHTIDTNGGVTSAFTPEQMEEHGISEEQANRMSKVPSPEPPQTTPPHPAGGKGKEEGEKILGKFSNQAELEKAYRELEKKFSQPKETNDKTVTTDKETEGKVSADEDTTDSESTETNKESSEDSDELREKFEALPEDDNKLAVAKAIKSLQDDPAELTDEVLEAFEGFGIPKELVKEHAELQVFKQEQEVISLMEAAGGKDGYEQMTKWAQDSLTPQEVKVFDNIVDNGTVEEVNFAISNLKARYDANTQPPTSNLIKADAISQAEAGYRSQAEAQHDMESPEYDKNPAYRRKVADKLRRSNF